MHRSLMTASGIPLFRHHLWIKKVKEHAQSETQMKKADMAVFVGKLVAQRAKEKGIQKVVFDRNGFLYHGRVKAVSDGAREAGLEF